MMDSTAGIGMDQCLVGVAVTRRSCENIGRSLIKSLIW